MSRASGARLTRAIDELGAVAGVDLADVELRPQLQDVALDTPFAAAEGAAAALAAGAGTAALIARERGAHPGPVHLATRHAEASLLGFAYLSFSDPARAPALRVAPEERTAAAGFYPTRDGRWVYLHSGFPHNTAGLLELLGTPDDRAAVARAIAGYAAGELEDAIAEAGLCGAMVRTAQQWDASVAGRLLGSRPVVEIVQVGDSRPEPFADGAKRPLEGVKVLDLTRILAGPTCARTLASYGARVLRIGAARLPSIPLFVADTGFGKRSAFLDLAQQADRLTLSRLVGEADVFSQGYRSGAMERLGFGVADVARMRPGIVYVSINCYGHEGPWRTRPGWEQLAQTVTGMAEAQGRHLGADQPTLLPAAVTDYTTGYLAAFGTLVALHRRARLGGSYWVRVSLARTGMWVRALGQRRSVAARAITPAEIEPMRGSMDTAWSRCRYLCPAVRIDGLAVEWREPPVPLGTHAAAFQD